MKPFSNEEFDVIFNEIVTSKFVCYDTLLYVSERMLHGAVSNWCYNDSALRGRQYEDDTGSFQPDHYPGCCGASPLTLQAD